MDTLTRDDLQVLIEPRGGRCVSLYMPAFRRGTEQQQNVVRFSNLLRDAQRQLLAAGVGSAEADTLLAPARRLATDEEFWRHQSDGVAAFVAPDFLRHDRLPIKFGEIVVATHHFEVRPLLPWVAATGRFYVLALGTEHAGLFRGTAFGIHEVHVEGMPASLPVALNEEITGGSEIQSRGELARQPGERGTGFYGHGGERDYAKDKLLRFFRIVDRRLHPLLRDQSAPLVLAGVAYLQPIYREANTCPHLADGGVDGTPDVLGEETLRERAWAIVEPLFLKRQNEALARYGQFAHTGHASSDIREVAQAAREGRVETLFVAIEGQLCDVPDGRSRGAAAVAPSDPGSRPSAAVAAGAGESGMNESHHANLADRERPRNRMEREGRAWPCRPQREPFGRLAAAPWSPADIGRVLPPAFCCILWGGRYDHPRKGWPTGLPRSPMGNLGVPCCVA